MAEVTTYRLSKPEIEAMLQQAAQQGAREALTRIGLSDDNAPHDVRELRQLIDHDINALLASPFGAQLRAGRVAQRVASFET